MMSIFNATLTLDQMDVAAQRLVTYLKSMPDQKSWIIALNGELSSGKTTLFQRFLKTSASMWDRDIASQKYVQSPTFFYLKTYEGPRVSLWHVDGYRMPPPLWTELLTLWEEDLTERTHVLWVEWYALVSQTAPHINIQIDFPDDEDKSTCRNIRMMAHI